MVLDLNSHFNDVLRMKPLPDFPPYYRVGSSSFNLFTHGLKIFSVAPALHSQGTAFKTRVKGAD